MMPALGELCGARGVQADGAGREGGWVGGRGEIHEVDVVPIDEAVGVVEGGVGGRNEGGEDEAEAVGEGREGGREGG